MATEDKALRNKRVGRKDRHSKICTAKGTRDRRMRLSLNIARKFFDLQDMLGFDRASKTIDWLFTKSNAAIKELAGSSSNCVFSMEDEQKEVSKSKISLGKEAREKARSRARERARERMRIKERDKNFSSMPSLEEIEMPCMGLIDHRIVEEFLGFSEEKEMDPFGCGGLFGGVVLPQQSIGGSGYMAISSAFPLYTYTSTDLVKCQWPCYNS